MSTYISSYVEKFNKKTNQWELISKNCFSDNFKHYLNSYDYTDWYNFNLILNKKELSSEIKEIYEIDEEGNANIEIRYVTLKGLHDYAIKQVENYISKTNSLFTALGLRDMYRVNEDEEVFEDGKYDDEGNIKNTYNPMTFPINKELLIEWNDSEIKAFNMTRLLGICESIYEQCAEMEDGCYVSADSNNIRIIMALEN